MKKGLTLIEVLVIIVILFMAAGFIYQVIHGSSQPIETIYEDDSIKIIRLWDSDKMEYRQQAIPKIPESRTIEYYPEKTP